MVNYWIITMLTIYYKTTTTKKTMAATFAQQFQIGRLDTSSDIDKLTDAVEDPEIEQQNIDATQQYIERIQQDREEQRRKNKRNSSSTNRWNSW